MTPSTHAASAPTHVPVAEARNVTKRYAGTVALDDAGIVVHAGRTHALVGRNGAGKSTMVSILTGLQRPDDGLVTFDGAPAPALSDRDGWRRRVACVYQKSTIIPSLSVAENLLLNRQSVRGPIRWGALRRRATDLLDQYDVPVDPRALAGDLTVEQCQMVEIARALSFGARFIVLDEPTAQLDGAAIAGLFQRMRDLQSQGVTFLFISHHLQEIYEVCQDVTVYRDARHVLTTPVADLPATGLVEAMTGEGRRVNGHTAARRIDEAAFAALEVSDLTLPGHYTDVSLRVRVGEIVGLAGGGGSGKAAVAETIAGLRRATHGAVRASGLEVMPGDVREALDMGIGFVPQDRNREGLVSSMSVAENATLTIAHEFGPAGFIPPRRRRALAERMIGDLAIKTDGPDQPVGTLSGGNAQKVVMARALASAPRALVLIGPTAGVDVRSKEFLLGVVAETASRGTGVVMVSDELDDLRLCDRVLVMVKGHIVREMSRGWADADLVAAMEGVLGR